MKKHVRMAACLLVLLTVAFGAAGEAGIELTAVPGTVRVRPAGPVQGSASAEIAAAKGEVESFQVVVTAVGGNLKWVKAMVSALSDGTHTLPTECVRIFREEFIPIRQPGYGATQPPGFVPDPLVPFVNPYTGEAIGAARWDSKKRKMTPGRFGGSDFAVWEGRHQPLWVDVSVPVDAAPGVYTGTFSVRAEGVDAVSLPVRVEVWDFALPAGPTHENHFGGFGRVAGYCGLKADSEAFQRIEDRYNEMIAAHRINPAIPRRLFPAVKEDGTADFSAVDQGLTGFVAKYHVTNLEIPRAPFGDKLGADSEKTKTYYRTWYAYLESKGWTKGAYHYMLDEPNDPKAYDAVRKLGAQVKEADPRIRCLVVEQPYTQNPEWGTLDEAIDIWCPLFGFVHEESVKRVQAQGDEVWSYSALVQRAPKGYYPNYETVKGDHPPYWELQFPVASYRVSTWLNRRYGITGLLYWSMVYWGSPPRNPWDDGGFRGVWYGDGALFYPGEDAGIEGPVSSLRLKNLRDSMEDYEYFAILEQRGGKAVVDAIVREAVPTWGSWNQDPYALPKLRRRLAEEIVKRK